MEREQIIKALECCTSGNSVSACMRGCPLYEKEDCECINDDTALLKYALALIEEQDEQIFKLEKRIEECESGYSQTLALERAKVKELTEKNNPTAVTLIKEHCKTVERTVILVCDRLKERIKGVYLDEGEMCAIIDEVAGKILNGNTEGKSD